MKLQITPFILTLVILCLSAKIAQGSDQTFGEITMEDGTDWRGSQLLTQAQQNVLQNLYACLDSMYKDVQELSSNTSRLTSSQRKRVRVHMVSRIDAAREIMADFTSLNLKLRTRGKVFPLEDFRNGLLRVRDEFFTEDGRSIWTKKKETVPSKKLTPQQEVDLFRSGQSSTLKGIDLPLPDVNPLGRNKDSAKTNSEH